MFSTRDGFPWVPIIHPIEFWPNLLRFTGHFIIEYKCFEFKQCVSLSLLLLSFHFGKCCFAIWFSMTLHSRALDSCQTKSWNWQSLVNTASISIHFLILASRSNHIQTSRFEIFIYVLLYKNTHKHFILWFVICFRFFFFVYVCIHVFLVAVVRLVFAFNDI